jgi:hypothetical protein
MELFLIRKLTYIRQTRRRFFRMFRSISKELEEEGAWRLQFKFLIYQLEEESR